MPAPHGDRVAFAVSTPTTGPEGQIRPPGDCHAVGRGNLQQQLTSVFPMTESGPGLGGAKRQKSSTEFTIQEFVWFSSTMPEMCNTHSMRFDTSTYHYDPCHICWCRTGPAHSGLEHSTADRSRCTSGLTRQQRVKKGQLSSASLMSRQVAVNVDCPSKGMRGTSEEGRKKVGEQWRR